MQKKRWIHPLFKPSETSSRDLNMFCSGKRYSPRYRNEPEIVAYVPLGSQASGPVQFGVLAQASFAENLFANRLVLFLGTTFLAITFSVFILLAQAKFYSAPRIAALDLSEFSLTQMEIVDKNTFLAKLSNQGRTQLASQVHYVTELIRGSRLSNDEAKRLATMIVLESARSGYDPLLVTAIVKSESTFNRHATSYAGAMGLMQIMPDTGRFVSKMKNVEWKGSYKLHDPEYNLRLGIAYLKHLETAFNGNKELMLIAYNWGPQNAIDAMKKVKSVPRSCVRYARTILNNHAHWNSDFSRNIAQFKHMDIDLS